jgi:hypothetical protein
MPFDGGYMIPGGLTTASLGRPVINNGLVVYYTFEQQTISGSSIYNQITPAKTGTLYNSPTLENGYSGKAMKFVGSSSQQVICGDGQSLGTGTTYTVMVRVKSDHAPGSSSVQEICASMGASVWYNLLNWDHSYSNYRQSWQMGWSNNWWSAKYTTSLQADTYYTLISTYNGTYLKAYLSDSLEATVQPPSDLTHYNSYAVGSGTSLNYFTGSIDEYRYYNRALSAGEISAIARLRG